MTSKESKSPDRNNVFVGYSNGLNCTRPGSKHGAVMVKIEINRAADRRSYELKSVSAHSLGRIPVPIVRVSAKQYEDRPSGPYDSLASSKWLLEKCGWSVGGLSREPDRDR